MTSMPMSFLRTIWSRIVRRRADILGHEQDQAIVRVALIASVLGFLVAQQSPLDFGQGAPGWLVFLAACLLFSVALAATALRDKKSLAYRRVVANVADVILLTYLMVVFGEAGAPLFVGYLLLILVNGFRFGLAAMGISTVLSMAGFAIVTLTVEYWHQHAMLSAGIIGALLLLPAYAAHLIRPLHRARARAEEASATKSQFLARMSHVLRTPLNGVLGTTDLLRNNRRLTAEDRELLDVIQESVSVSLRQIDSVLDFTRIEAGKLVLEQAEFDLHRTLHATVRMVSPAAREKNLRLLVRISPQVPFQLIGDAHHLRVILLNLLSNAIKFTHSGYVAIQVEPIVVADATTRLHFEIRDTGIGIAPEALGRIWQSFAQEDLESNRRDGGAGLGTTLAKQLVELMQGSIAVSSIKGRGTVFWCDLPFQRPSGRSQTQVAISGARVLLLSEDAKTLQHLQESVAGLHGTLIATATVAEAVAALGRGIRLNNPWHLVLVDEKLAVTPSDRHRADELAAKALISQTPLYLLTDSVRDSEQLCEWGYAGVLPRQPATALLVNAIHASPHYDIPASGTSGIVRVEPWAWGQDSKKAARILVVDDNRTNRLILEQVLGSAGYEVDVVSDGETGLQRLATGRYKAAVLDLHMPGMDGVDLLRRYRLLKAGARIPIVMLTADATFDAKSDSAEAGADAFLTKPVASELLLSTLERLILERQVRTLPVQAAYTDSLPTESEKPTLDVAVLAELDRLSRDPARFMAVIETFEAESQTLLTRMAEAISARNHSAYVEVLHALKDNAVNVGALRLAATCQRAEAAGVLDFRQQGMDRVRGIGEQVAAACQALRELCPHVTSPGRSDPA